MAISSEQVRELIEVPDDADIDWAVNDATALTTGLFSALSDQITPTQIDLVAKYLAAHFLALRYERGGLSSERQGSAQETYVGARDLSGLQLSRYGQQAISLDPTGELAKMDSTKRGKAEFRVVRAPL